MALFERENNDFGSDVGTRALSVIAVENHFVERVYEDIERKRRAAAEAAGVVVSLAGAGLATVGVATRAAGHAVVPSLIKRL